MEQPSINDIVTADSSVLDIVPLFAHRKRRYLCVLDGNEHVGIISFGALDSPEFRMCLLIKTLELEDLALKLISYGAKESWNALNKLRQNKVIENYERKHRKKCDYKIGVPSIPYEELLKCTYHCDKYTIINSRGMLSGISKSELNDLRKRVEEVRNSFAHSSDVSKSGTFLYDPFGMKKFLEDVNLLDVSLRNAIAVKKNAPVFL